jgi:RNA polymerase sigma-70 factor, ECF subfamily
LIPVGATGVRGADRYARVTEHEHRRQESTMSDTAVLRERAPRGADREEDAELVARLSRGEEAAFLGLVNRYSGALLRVALVFMADRAKAEEVVQETWLAVLRGVHRFEGRSSLRTWLFRILTNLAKTRAVRERRMVTFSELERQGNGDDRAVEADRFDAHGRWSDPPGPWPGENPETQLLRRETLAVLARELDGLPPAQRAVVTLRDIEGLEPSDVCTILEISDSNQRVLLHRGRARLRRALERHLRPR